LTDDLCGRAVDLYANRRDKEWGLTDCCSFIAMQDAGITQALSADRHFVQAGFEALLLAE
jgi:predicted nucleic acid-binding protein